MFCADDGRKRIIVKTSDSDSRSVGVLCNETSPSPWTSLNAKWLLVCWSFLPCAMHGTGSTNIAVNSVNGGDTEGARFEIEPMPPMSPMTFSSCGCDNLV